MIKQEQASNYFESKKTSGISESSLNNFSKAYRELAKIIVPPSKKNVTTKITSHLSTFKKYFGEDASVNPWKSKEGATLATLLFGKQDKYIADVWDIIETTPYQTSWNRRSFRAKPKNTYLKNKIAYLQQLYKSIKLGQSNLDILELAQYDVYTNFYSQHAYIFAVALNRNESGLFELIKDIIQGEDEIGGVSRNLIKGLLLSNANENWKLVEDLLLAAQRQEGLRQTILEALDETSIGALNYFINVILENNLVRFSSVIRAIDTWFGFGWEAPKSTTIKKILTLCQSYFKDSNLTEKALKSKDNLEVYTALWFIGLTDVDKANLLAIDLMKTGTKEKKILACMFIVQTERTFSDVVNVINDNFGNNLDLDYWLLKTVPFKFELKQEVFDKCIEIAKALPKTGKQFTGSVFEWNSYTVTADSFYQFLIRYGSDDQVQSLASDISQIPSEKRLDLIRKIFPNHYTWSYNYDKKELPSIDFKSEPWKKPLIHQCIMDRNESVMATGMRLFDSMELTSDDFDILEDLLTRKAKILRKFVIDIILKQEDKKTQQITSNLVSSNKIEQRLAGLEILTILHDREQLSTFVEEQVASYKQRPKLSKNESVFLNKFSRNAQEFTFANGFNIVNYNNLRPLLKPQLKFKNKKTNFLSKLIKPNTSTFLFNDIINEKKTINAINNLIALFIKNKNYEYQIRRADDSVETVILENGVNLTNYERYNREDATAQEKLDALPLAEVWKKWYNDSKLNNFEMMAAIHYSDKFANPYSSTSRLIPFLKQYIPELRTINLDKSAHWNSINRKINTILSYLQEANADYTILTQFKIDVLEDMIARFPENLKNEPLTKNRWSNNGNYWCDNLIYLGMGTVEKDIENGKLSTNQLLHYWDLKMYLTACKLSIPNPPESISKVATINPKKKSLPIPSGLHTVLLYKNNAIGDNDFRYQCLLNTNLFEAVDGKINYRTKRMGIDQIPKDIITSLKENLLKTELERGDLETEATPYMNCFNTIKGSHYLIDLLSRLGKDNFSRGYYYDESRKNTFSGLIKKSVPAPHETVEDFIELAKTSKITKKRWLELALYAPQWASWIEQYLKIDKLEDAIWWFHAHGSDYMNAEKETVISRYSSIEGADFVKGAIDIDWFNEVYVATGKSNWKLLHDAAKYITDGNGHRQVKLYSGVMLGEIKIRETLAKIKEKRDKDYVKALGLVPLSKANAKKDLLARYNLLQDFLKESKQFGSQRQESEKSAVNIALDNLSRNAGFEDSIRFSWAMEAEATQAIMEQATVTIDNVVIQLIINKDGKTNITVTKDGKSQKTIPAKYKKEKAVKALQNNRSYLKKQYSRTRISLENAMLREDEFSAEEISGILIHPIVNPLLKKLVLFNKKTKEFGFWNNGNLQTAEGKIIKIKKEDSFVIAHPSHLYENVVWDLYQKYAFDTKLTQPFKQIFRELYVITKDEIELGIKSERYQGHQIQPKKTIALLRSRGWTVSNEEGLQKVYHKKGYIATMYAMADWFSPSDIEAPTLEQVCFYSRKDYKPIPLKDIDAVTFSEVMRDIDLVVSVAHVGGVDPEASHSTMQMRGALARETARLFKATNVEVKERHILINGKLADYTIHLGSGLISKNGLRLSIIPVHSQHRGRLFLPFVDDDPKSAEIISKMKLLSEDDKIKDPTILAQLNSY
ncbi:DUF4132 domain-containing protein [Aureibaculum marinum]|uniref:DUF4132 domain-containing protein n=1 Tax=Aureibaculum marinum TaxID=2487930 RepID=A0A3N4NKF3_9FLAO|nr:DUF4132 domain-containing protein [Aureibaculum marinum]RPD96701.1 DUF4132 domain-containing protein [Aureibaculum marinum]